MANITHGGDRKSDEIKPTVVGLISQERAAQVMGVCTRTVQRAARVLRDAPEQVKDIEEGRATVRGAVRFTRRCGASSQASTGVKAGVGA